MAHKIEDVTVLKGLFLFLNPFSQKCPWNSAMIMSFYVTDLQNTGSHIKGLSSQIFHHYSFHVIKEIHQSHLSYIEIMSCHMRSVYHQALNKYLCPQTGNFKSRSWSSGKGIFGNWAPAFVWREQLLISPQHPLGIKGIFRYPGWRLCVYLVFIIGLGQTYKGWSPLCPVLKRLIHYFKLGEEIYFCFRQEELIRSLLYGSCSIFRLFSLVWKKTMIKIGSYLPYWRSSKLSV